MNLQDNLPRKRGSRSGIINDSKNSSPQPPPEGETHLANLINITKNNHSSSLECYMPSLGLKSAIQLKNHYSNYGRAVIFLFNLFVFSSLSGQSTLAKVIDFETENTPIADALIDLSEVAEISIAFHPRLFSRTQKISLSHQQKSLDYILKACLKTTNVTFKLENAHIILYEKPKEYFTLSGYIEDSESGERLVAATIWEAYSGKGTTSNDYGFFSLKVPEGKIELQSSYLGYQGRVEALMHSKNRKINIALKPSITLQEVIVTDAQFDKQQAHLALGKGEKVNLNDLTTNISLGGEPDLLRFLGTKAGVQSGSDGIGGMNVRGGPSDQNLVLLDGVPIYNPSHSLGLFSVFNTHIIKSANFLTDGFSAKYGGRLSSVLDVRVKEGNTKEWKAEAEIGTLASKLVVEGPVKKDKSGLIVALRRTHLDPLLKKLSAKNKERDGFDGSINYFFFDINSKFHHRFSAKDQVFISYYQGQDDYKDMSSYYYEDIDFDEFDFEEQEQQLFWGNKIGSLRWNHLFGNQLFSNTTFTLSQYDYRSLNYLDQQYDFAGGFDYNYYFYTFVSKVKDAGLKIDLEYYPNSQHQVLFGGGFLFRSFESGEVNHSVENAETEEEYLESINLIDNFYVPPLFKTKELNFYIEDNVAISEQLSLQGGVHFALFLTNGKNYFIPQPRFSIQSKLTPNWSTKLSASKMAQSLHILSTSGGGLPSDLWVPSTSNVAPETALQFAWNLNYDAPKGWQANFDVFYKKMDNLITYFDDALFTNLPGLVEIDPTFWEENITTGTGKSYGFSTSFSRNKGNLTGQLNYAYIISERTFEENTGGGSYPFRFNHPHELKASIKYQINPKFSFFAHWQYGSGQAYTLIKTASRFIPLSNLVSGDEERIGSINGNRLPAYHRLDAGFYYKWQGEKVDQSLNIGVYNLYNRKNPYFQYFQEDLDFPEESGIQQQNVLPILPSISYRVVF